ncbi:LOW QUALITY PROTEIN: hypothetical protein OSB04_006543 [Centaurea solstitialis]|uniref:CCHC-type domain-containing protein n=1 Tax=Centaurea solstitialis TaxID=347529 RepID=A0AA38U2Q4_9ASTR|nr:LOW QUALITY PROTEIN: hypothetical protein OSB04_006543 [Centaurea solstitialis]
MKFQHKGKGLIVEDHDWDDDSSDESFVEEDTQETLMAVSDEPNLALMAKIEEVSKEVPEKAPETSSSTIESSSQVPSTYIPLKSLTQLDLLTLDLYNALNGKTTAEKMNIDLRYQLKDSYHSRRKLERSINQALCIEREKAIAAKEKTLAELNAVTIKGWSDASEKVDEILASGRCVKNRTGIGFSRGCPKPDRSMLKFGMFVSTIPDPNDPQYSSSSNTRTEGDPKSKKSTTKDKSIAKPHSKKSTPKQKNVNILGGGPLVSGTKRVSQNPTPRLKVDLKTKAKEKKPIPPISDANGVLGPGPAHLKFKDFLDPTKCFLYRKCYHCGLNDHIASKCPNATKAEKSAKVKKIPKTDKTVKGKKVVKTESLVKTPATDTDKSVKAVTDSIRTTDTAGPIVVKGSFSGNGKGQTHGYDTLTNGVTTFKRVAYVKGLMHNLLSTSQLCDKNHYLSFSKKKCKVKNKHKKVILSGARRADVSNKIDEIGTFICNKARIVAHGYQQEECIDYDETFAPVARLKAIRLFLAYAAHKNFKVFQMDINNAFLNAKLPEEVYVAQPPGFLDPKFPNHAYKLNKALYGLKHAPRARYDTLSTFLLCKGFERGKIDNTLFLKKYEKHIILLQIYVDDIIFGSTNSKLCKKFELLMQSEYKMSMMGLLINQSEKGIFINQVLDMLKKFDLTSCTPIKTPMAPPLSLDKDSNGKHVDVTLYR